jgi:phosphoribosylformylglycinamidine cyclo-ligase
LEEELLTPTHLYENLTFQLNSLVHAYANVTGGGVENLPRVIPQNLALKLKAWPWPRIFQEVQSRAGLSAREMVKTLNCGAGFAVFCRPEQAEPVRRVIASEGYLSLDLGEVVPAGAEGDGILWPEEWT